MHWHKWGRWTIGSGEAFKRGQMVEVTLQWRMCDKCGLTETRLL